MLRCIRCTLAHPTRTNSFACLRFFFRPSVGPFGRSVQEEQRQQTAVPGGISTTTNGFFSTFDAAIIESAIVEKWDLAAQNDLGTSNCGEALLSDCSNRRGEIFTARLVGDHVGGGSAAAGTAATSDANECALLHHPTTSSASLEAVRTHFGKEERRKRRSRKAGRKRGEIIVRVVYVSPTHSTRNSLACVPFSRQLSISVRSRSSSSSNEPPFPAKFFFLRPERHSLLPPIRPSFGLLSRE